MTKPLRMSFEVACSAGHAFTVWTSGIGAWWPPDHTMTGRAEAVVLQGGVGGRIYERTADGTEHEWGEVTVWQPPARLAYLWYLGRGRADATEVEIRFLARGTDATRVEIEHRGWERLGTDAQPWRDRNQANWQTLLPHFITAITEGERLWPQVRRKTHGSSRPRRALPATPCTRTIRPTRRPWSARSARPR